MSPMAITIISTLGYNKHGDEIIPTMSPKAITLIRPRTLGYDRNGDELIPTMSPMAITIGLDCVV